MVTQDQPKNGVFRLPWPAVGACLTAMAALLVSSGPSWALPLLMFGLLGTYVWRARLNDQIWTRWTARIILFTLVIAASARQISTTGDVMFDPGTVHAFGQLCAAELVIQCWRRKPDGGQRGVAMVLLSALVFLAASNTYENTYIRWFTPLYMLFLILSMREFRAAAAGPPPAVQRGFPLAWLSGVLVLVLSMGALSSFELWNNRDVILQWDANLMGQQQAPELVGLSASPTLSSSFDMKQSPLRVLKIVGDLTDNHLRGQAFETYSNRRWGPDVRERSTATLDPAMLQPQASGSNALFTRMADDSGVVFVPLSAAGLAPVDAGEFGWDGKEGGPLRTRSIGIYHYMVILSLGEGYQGPFCTPLLPEERNRCLTIPKELDPRVRLLAQQIGAGRSSPKEKAAAVVQYLLSNYGYSLTFRAEPGDPISNFILGKKPAHCQYFASSAVMLLRCLGVPARYVQGYYAHETSGKGVTIVRQRDAHAWTEAWMAGQGWITLDATPGGGRPDRLSNALPFWQKGWDWLQDQSQEVRSWATHLKPGQKTGLIGCLAALLLAVLGWRSVKKSRPISTSAAGYSSAGEALAALAARFEALLARKAVSCPQGRPWQEHLFKLISAQESQNQPGKPRKPMALDIMKAQHFVSEYYKARFGPPNGAANVRRASDLLDELEK